MSNVFPEYLKIMRIRICMYNKVKTHKSVCIVGIYYFLVNVKFCAMRLKIQIVFCNKYCKSAKSYAYFDHKNGI